MINKHLRKLQKVSETKDSVTRLGLSDWEDKAHEAAASVFSRSRRIKHIRDQAGNSFIVNGEPKGKYVVMGSHLDTVPNGGRLDGALTNTREGRRRE